MLRPAKKGQASLVAMFGDKFDAWPHLWQLLQHMQALLLNHFGEGVFIPYTEQRIHATIIGLEGDREGDRLLNRNAYQKLQQRRIMDLRAALKFLLTSDSASSMAIKIGGFQADSRYSFTSNGRHPYLRSFSIQGSIAVTMGWPVNNGKYTSALDRLRRRFNEFNIFHKYHGSNEAYDNDFFLVLGNFSQPPQPDLTAAAEVLLRDLLATTEFEPISIGPEQFNMILYQEGDTTFEKVSVLTLEQAYANIDAIERFYPDLKS